MGAGCPHTPELKIPAYAGIFNMEGKLLFSLQTSFSASLRCLCRFAASGGALPHTPVGALPRHPAKGTRPFGNPIPRFARGIQGFQ